MGAGRVVTKHKASGKAALDDKHLAAGGLSSREPSPAQPPVPGGQGQRLPFSDFKLLHTQFQLQGRKPGWLRLHAHLMAEGVGETTSPAVPPRLH